MPWGGALSIGCRTRTQLRSTCAGLRLMFRTLSNSAHRSLRTRMGSRVMLMLYGATAVPPALYLDMHQIKSRHLSARFRVLCTMTAYPTTHATCPELSLSPAKPITSGPNQSSPTGIQQHSKSANVIASRWCMQWQTSCISAVPRHITASPRTILPNSNA